MTDQWSETLKNYVEIRPGEYARKDSIQEAIPCNKSASRPRKPERLVRNEPMGEDEGKKTYSGRVHVCITRRAKRLLDPDNNSGKFFIDSLRYSSILRDDTEKDVTIEMRQEKTKEKEETIIELYHYESDAI